jgi:HPt (histidine-containing phosphotransfer) domain-containing protein
MRYGRTRLVEKNRNDSHLLATPASPTARRMRHREAFEAALQALQADYVRSLDDYLNELCLHASPPDDKAARSARQAALARIAHKLAGTGGTYGFPAITEAARDLERMLKTGHSESELSDAIRSVEAACYEAIGATKGAALA